jgi:hypothetical protein
MAETHQNKASEVKLKTTGNVLGFGPQIQVFHRKKFLLYKCIIKPIWKYGIELWCCTKQSNTKIIQRFQSEVLCLIINAPCYGSNLPLHNGLQIPFVVEEIHRLSTLYHQSVLGHNNRLVAGNSNLPNARRRMRRLWPTDLPQLANEKSCSYYTSATGLVRVSSVDYFSTQNPTYNNYTHYPKTREDYKCTVY